MPPVEGRSKLNVEFFLTPEEGLHCFAQWMEKNPSTKLEELSTRKYLNAIREVLAEQGWRAVEAKLPDRVEMKKMDYKAVMKGIIA